MPVGLAALRDELMPGLLAMRTPLVPSPLILEAVLKYRVGAGELLPSMSPIMVGPGAIVAMGVAAAVIKNPTVSRRIFSWFGR